MAHIFQINVSHGGAPKHALLRAEVDHNGLTGDRHNDRKEHGGPDRALCLFPLEHILALQQEGHQLFPGAVGENLTVAGLDWDAVVPGARLRLGHDVLIEISGYAPPCEKIGRFFSDTEYRRISQEHHPGWSRAYARVLHGGRLQVGDPITRS